MMIGQMIHYWSDGDQTVRSGCRVVGRRFRSVDWRCYDLHRRCRRRSITLPTQILSRRSSWFSRSVDCLHGCRCTELLIHSTSTLYDVDGRVPIWSNFVELSIDWLSNFVELLHRVASRFDSITSTLSIFCRSFHLEFYTTYIPTERWVGRRWLTSTVDGRVGQLIVGMLESSWSSCQLTCRVLSIAVVEFVVDRALSSWTLLPDIDVCWRSTRLPAICRSAYLVRYTYKSY